MASRGASAAAAAMASANKFRKAAKESKVTLPVFGDQLTEVKKQLGLLCGLFEKLSKEYDEHVAKQIMPPRAFVTAVIAHTETMAPTQATLEGEGHPPRELLEGDEEAVKVLIDEKKLDPNATFENTRVIGKDFSTATPLAIAVLRGRKEMVDLLVEAGANMESKYSFIAGAEQSEWSGTAINAAIPSGNLDMVKHLVKLGADINTAGSNGASLVWQAAYFNQTKILEYFIENDVNVNTPAKSQDNAKVTYTPLHAAAMAGHTNVVAMLLDARAHHSNLGDTRQPLEDAVKHCHAEVVNKLLVAKADLFAPVHPEGKDVKSKSGRCIDLIFDSANPVMLQQVAQGLSQSSCERMCKADFIRFLGGPGEASCTILDTIFQRFKPYFWEESDGKRFRMLKTAAFVNADDAVNIVEGPAYRVILNAFNKKQLLPDHTLEFLSNLLPQQPRGNQNMFVPVTCYMCHIPMLHKDLQVLLAIADCQNPHIFSCQGCQAIINLAWGVERKLARFRMVLALLEVIALFFINLFLTEAGGWEVMVANICALSVWMVAVVVELLQLIGYISRGLIRRYLCTPRYWFDMGVLLFTGGINITLLNLDSPQQNVAFKTCFGILVFAKWMRFLTFLRQIKSIGRNILPITHTMWASIPFGLVLGVYLIGAVNMYYALGIYPSLFDSFLIVYRLVVLGDMDFAEMENEFSPKYIIHDTLGEIEQITVISEKYYEIVRLFVVFVSFFLGLTMMNLFVAILCLEYGVAQEAVNDSFMRSLTGIVLDQRAIRLGTRTVLCRGNNHVDEETVDYSGATLKDESVKARRAYVWYAMQSDKKL